MQDGGNNFLGEIENLGLTDAIFHIIYAWTPPNICMKNLKGKKEVIVFSFLLNSAEWTVQFNLHITFLEKY